MHRASLFISCYRTIRKRNCKNLNRQRENQLMLQDGEIDNHQRAGYHSVSSHINV
jgi:hypothetical protein